ncbi:MAG: ATP-dependent zinc protease [Alphaproteobacteria bacterium]|nr:ATP-dependent zinc protease [Alphaproteobacteria bacterium]
MKKILHLLSLFALFGCAAEKTAVVPAIVPNTVQETKIIKVMPNNVIGAVERIYLPPMKSAFLSRIDTGATTSSLDVDSLKYFERDGKKWVAFTIVNRETNEEHVFEKPLVKNIKIKRIEKNERRPIVEMTVKMGGETFKADFTIAEREKFEYQTLIGRNILSGRAIVDVSLSNTLK